MTTPYFRQAKENWYGKSTLPDQYLKIYPGDVESSHLMGKIVVSKTHEYCGTIDEVRLNQITQSPEEVGVGYRTIVGTRKIKYLPIEIVIGFGENKVQIGIDRSDLRQFT